MVTSTTLYLHRPGALHPLIATGLCPWANIAGRTPSQHSIVLLYFHITSEERPLTDATGHTTLS